MHDRRDDDSGFDELADELEALFLGEPSDAPSDPGFDELALRVFRHQFETNPTYRAFCEARDARPDDLNDWRDVPAVPTTAFKHLDLVSATGDPEAVFRTSGTSEGRAARGRHFVPRLSLYRASLLGPFRAHVIGGEGPSRFVSLVPSAAEVPDSSLSYMISTAAAELSSETDWVVGAAGRMDLETLRAVVDESGRSGEPIALLGTALSFAHLLERLGDRPLTHLAPGSRVMETGGFKGLEREVTREGLHGALSEATGVPAGHIVNEYGMTELLSQLYEPVLADGPRAAGTHVPPWWLRVRALDPSSLEPVEDGREGILGFFDLANAGSISHVLSQDVGSIREGRVRLRGRLSGAEPRGCSRAMDELMTAAAPAR